MARWISFIIAINVGVDWKSVTVRVRARPLHYKIWSDQDQYIFYFNYCYSFILRLSKKLHACDLVKYSVVGHIFVISLVGLVIIEPKKVRIFIPLSTNPPIANSFHVAVFSCQVAAHSMSEMWKRVQFFLLLSFVNM